MPEISVPWGAATLELDLPAHWTVRQVAQPQMRPAPGDWTERLARALNQPGTGPGLDRLLAARRAGRVELIVEDDSRHSPLPEILAIVLREVRHAGFSPQQIGICFATGRHPPMTPDAAAAKLGDAADGIAWRCNPWDDPSAYVRAGRVGRVEVLTERRVAQADLRIVISAVNPHLQAGFGGGYKMLYPGCAHESTIGGLHRLGVGRSDRQLVGTDPQHNPMRRAIDAAGELLDAGKGTTFTVQYLLDADGLPETIATGRPVPTHRMLAKRCAVTCGVVPESPADVLITNAHPLDGDLWQSFKCIANTRYAAAAGAPIICLTRCANGLAGMRVPAWPLSPAWTRRAVRALGPEALATLVTRLVPRLAGDAAFFVRMALRILHRNPLLLVSPTLAEAGVRFPGMESFADPADAIDAADERLNGTEARATIFPAGGVTFPVPRA
ncbi:MAG: lactate racemase domain-containing protein [Planctomycetota bacterium]